MAGRPRAHAADELLLFAEIVHAATTTDSLDTHVGLHDLLSEWAHRLAADGASLHFARVEIESATLPLLIDVGLDPRAAPARVREIETQITRWIADEFSAGPELR